MKHIRSVLVLLAVQLLLVLSVAGKYLYERKVCPQVWARATQVDPNQPLRGRYLAMQLLVDACSLPRDQAHNVRGYSYPGAPVQPGSWTWRVSLGVADGRLIPRLEDHLRTPDNIQQLTLRKDKPCDRVPLRSEEEYFIPDRAKGPFPLKPGQELWVEVTMPPSGLPRPIQLALSSEAGFQPLSFE
jgi:hypothetical protein